jgi:hypothetical protein
MSVTETQADLDKQIVDLLAIYGKPVTVVRRTNPTYDPPSGAVGADQNPLALTVLVQALPDVVLPDGTERRGMRFVVRVADLPAQPVLVQDFVTYNAFRYEIFGVTTPDPGATQFLDARLT